MHVASLHIHPLKSCAVVDVDALSITPRGPEHDRRWLAVDADGRFITARQHAAMVGIRAMPHNGGLLLHAPGMPALQVPPPAPAGARMQATIWRDRVDALTCDPSADAWLSDYLGMPARLVHLDDAAHRAVDPDFARAGDEVGFADAYPLMVISQASLDGLNARLAAPVPMRRFRPNIAIAGSGAHAEDKWRRVRIGAVEFEAVKACTRCVFTTIDPVSMTRDAAGEPLRTLTQYRRTTAGVTFGMNLIPRGTGVVRPGNAVVVLD